MNTQFQKSVVLIGGGHTHALVLNELKTEWLEGSHVTVINPDNTSPYSGMLPGFVAGHYRRDELDIDIKALSQKAGATLIIGKAISMDLDQKVVKIDDGSQISYDLVSVDVGITTRMISLPGFFEHGVPAKPLGRFSTEWDNYQATTGPKRVIVIGGGIAGAELAMAIAFALKMSSDDVAWPLSNPIAQQRKNAITRAERTQKEQCICHGRR